MTLEQIIQKVADKTAKGKLEADVESMKSLIVFVLIILTLGFATIAITVVGLVLNAQMWGANTYQQVIIEMQKNNYNTESLNSDLEETNLKINKLDSDLQKLNIYHGIK